MQFVISVCVTLVLAWLAVFVTASGLKVSTDTATMIQKSQSSEYKAHYCGSLRAAIANFESARDLLMNADASKAKDYKRASMTYISPLEEALNLNESSCDQFQTSLHTQSFEETPFDLPNQVYRLSSLDSL